MKEIIAKLKDPTNLLILILAILIVTLATFTYLVNSNRLSPEPSVPESITEDSGGAASSEVSGVLDIKVVSVVIDTTVTFTTYNFPPNQNFVLTMGKMGTLGVDGWVLDTINSGTGGSATYTYSIPDAFLGNYQISIRLQSAQGYYTYNWFYNNTAGGTGGPPAPTPSTGGTPPPTPTPTSSIDNDIINTDQQGGSLDYNGIPTIKVVSVNQGKDVIIQTDNFPSDQIFDVSMGYMGTQGYGIKTGDVITEGGNYQQKFTIPPSLANTSRISIRAETRGTSKYYAYNSFWNNTLINGSYFRVDSPEKMVSNISGIIRLDHIAPDLSPFQGNFPTTTITGRVQSYAAPRVSLVQDYGSDVNLCIQAELKSAAFDIVQSPEDCQLVDSTDLIWEWSVIPASNNVSGKQNIIARVKATWEDEEGKIVAEREIWRDQIIIDVNHPSYTTGQIALLPTLAALMTAMFLAFIKPSLTDIMPNDKKDEQEVTKEQPIQSKPDEKS